MIPHRFARAATGFLLLAAAIHPAAAQQEVVSDGAYLHAPARAEFPTRIGKFRRSQILRYGATGDDVSASYLLATPAGRLLITVYIYPAAAAANPAERAKSCDEEFAAANTAISSKHANAAPIEQGGALPAKGSDRKLGRRSVYRLVTWFDDRFQDIRSEAHLYCYVGGDWLVKYRVSAPIGVKTDKAVKQFIRNGPWPGRSST